MEYKETYGRYKTPPDRTRCAEVISGSNAWFSATQCSRKAKCDPDEHGNPTTCKQHSAEAVNARRSKEKAKYDAEMRNFRVRGNAYQMYTALKQIADGHNDARQLAIDSVALVDRK